MRTRTALSLLLAGTAIITCGATFKLLHWPTANIQMMIGATVQCTALLVLAFKVGRTLELRELLDQ